MKGKPIHKVLVSQRQSSNSMYYTDLGDFSYKTWRTFSSSGSSRCADADYSQLGLNGAITGRSRGDHGAINGALKFFLYLSAKVYKFAIYVQLYCNAYV